MCLFDANDVHDQVALMLSGMGLSADVFRMVSMFYELFVTLNSSLKLVKLFSPYVRSILNYALIFCMAL